MSGGITDYGSRILLDYIFNRVPHPSISPCWGLSIAAPSKSSFLEISGNGYSRVETDATYFSTPNLGSTTQLKDINFPRSEGYEGEIYGLGLFQNMSESQPLVYWDISDIEMIKKNGGYTILTNGVTFQFSANSTLSQWMKHTIINYLFRRLGMSLGDDEFTIRYCTTTPNDITFGTEPTDSSYVAQTIARNGTNFNVKIREVEWLTDLQFPYAEQDQGNVANIGYFDGNQYIFWGTGNPLSIIKNSAFGIAAGTIFTMV